MPTQKPRVMVTVSDETMRLVDEYRFAKRFRSQSQAVNELIELGLAEINPQANAATKKEPVTMDGLTDEELEFIETFDALTSQNRRLLLGIGALILREQEKPPD